MTRLRPGALLIACAAAAAAAVPASAQSPVYSRDGAGRVTIRASRVAAPIAVDGKLDDEAYTLVQPLTEFLQAEPRQGAAVSERTEAWVLFDDDNLYFSCRCWDEHPERIVANEMRRDSPNLRQNDNFAVELDTFRDRRNGFLFYVTPLGAIFDGLTTDERQNNSDWNTVWSAKAGRFDGGWIAEIAIPFKSLRYAAGRDQVWGINLRRNIRAKNEWSYITPMEAAWGITAIFRVSAAATLVGLEVPRAARNLEVKPYAISRTTTDVAARPTVRNDTAPDVGVDFKYGITKSLTADLTYNTDFAQVEEDEAQVNLTRFTLFFPEKREFFLEGSGLFNFGAGGAISGGAPPPPNVSGPALGGGGDTPLIFYSRRIGLNGSRVVPIVVGGRLTGKSGAYNIGALNIETDDDSASAAPATNFTVFRLRRDVFRRSTIGAIVTSRSQSTVAAGSNQVWGADANFSFFQNVYVSGYLAQSKTPGRSGRDLSYRGQFNYAADRYGFTIDRLVVEPNFNPEVGFLRRENFRKSVASARFSPRPAGSRFVRKYFYEGNFEYTTDNQNRLQTRLAQATYRIELQNSDLITLNYARNYEFVPVASTIAGVRVPVGAYGFGVFSAIFNPGQQHRVSGSGSFEVGSFYHGDRRTATFRGRASLTDHLAVEPIISVNWIDLPTTSTTTSVLGQRALYTMTPRMFVTALIQYSSTAKTLSSNVRFRWEYLPGSELFVVYTEGRDALAVRDLPLQTRGFVVKINKLFRY